MFDDNYLEFSKFTDLPPLTRTQQEFANFCIKNHEDINKIGDLESVFRAVRKWLKTNPEMWIEHVLKEELKAHVAKTAPLVFNEVSEIPFDWKLSMTDIERKYKNKIPKPEQKEAMVPESVINHSKRNDVDYLLWPPKKQNIKCVCIGTVNEKAGKLFDIGSEVYYNEVGDNYIVYVKGICQTYNPSTFSRYVTYNGKLPNGKPKSFDMPTDDFMRIYMQKSGTENFHE